MDNGMLGEFNPLATPEERRRYVRVRKDILFDYTIVKKKMDVTSTATLNLSGGGLRFIVEEPLVPGTEVSLEFTMPATGTKFHADSLVMWCRYDKAAGQHEIGVSFTNMDRAERENVLSLIASELPSSGGSELRKFIRLERNLSVQLQEADRPGAEWVNARTTDISLGGVGMLTQEEVGEGKPVQLRLFLYGPREKPIEVKAVVLEDVRDRRGERRVRVRFQDLPPKTFETIANYITERVSGLPLGPHEGGAPEH